MKSFFYSLHFCQVKLVIEYDIFIPYLDEFGKFHFTLVSVNFSLDIQKSHGARATNITSTHELQLLRETKRIFRKQRKIPFRLSGFTV